MKIATVPKIDEFAILANALLLSDIHGMLFVRERAKFEGWTDRSILSEREQSQEREEFRYFLEKHSILDSRISGSQVFGCKIGLESLSQTYQRWAALIAGKENIAELRLIDLDFGEEEAKRHDLDPSPFEKRTPIASQNPNGITRRLKRIVVDHFERADQRLKHNSKPNQEIPVATINMNFEKKIVELLRGFYSANPNKRISGAKALVVLSMMFDVKKKAFELRIWKKFNEGRKLPSGAIPKTEALPPDDLENFCRKNHVIYELEINSPIK